MDANRSIFYDTEFLEDGKTIDLISIGMVDNAGFYYYAVNREADWDRVVEHKWLMRNVVPHLPLLNEDNPLRDTYCPIPIDFGHDDVKPLDQIADEVHDFVIEDGPNPHLWSWYGAYDHVRLMQLYGPMIDKPYGFPMFTMDLRQEVERLGLTSDDLPDPGSFSEHNALADAFWDLHAAGFISGMSNGLWPINFNQYRKKLRANEFLYLLDVNL